MTSFLIHRPIFAIVLNALVFLVGFLCWNQLELEEYPHIERPVFQISAFYSNASAELVETAITNPLEDLLAGVEGLKSMSSESRFEHSFIDLKFKEGTSLDRAMILVRDALSMAQDMLPNGVKSPTIQRGDCCSEYPFMAITLSSPTMNSAELTHFANLHIKNNFRGLKGVAAVELWAQPYVMNIGLDSKKMKNFGINCNNVIKALGDFNVSIPAGKFQMEVPVTFDLRLKNIDDFKNLVIKSDSGKSVFLQYIATIELGIQSDSMRQHVDGKPGIILAIRKAKEENPLQVASEVRETFAKLQKQVDQHVTMRLAADQSKVISQSLNNIRFALIESIILVFLVVLAFLGNWRSALIPLITIPLSIVGSFFFYFLLGISLNVLTMLAIVLAVGLVVDDAIVVIENIHRRLDQGQKALDAALEGSREILFPILAMTFTLASVYAPIAFIQGALGKLFAEFAIALAGAVIVSGFVALTLSPMMCAYLIRPSETHSSFDFIEKKLALWIPYYQNSLSSFLNINLRVIGRYALGLLGLIAFFYYLLPKEITPNEDRGFVGVYVPSVPGKNLDAIEAYLAIVEKETSKIPEASDSFVSMGQWGGNALVLLKDWNDRGRSTEEIRLSLKKALRNFPSLDIDCWTSNSGLPGFDKIGSPTSVQVIIQSHASYPELISHLDNLRKKLAKTDHFESVHHKLRLSGPAYRIHANNKYLVDMGLDPKKVSETLEIFQGGCQRFEFLFEEINYPISIKGNPMPWSLDELYITNDKGDSISFGAFLTLEESTLPKRLTHHNQMRSAIFQAELKPGQSIYQGLNYLTGFMKENLPANLKMEWEESLQLFLETSNTMASLCFLALIFIYAILAMQFESWIDPFIIMVTVPLASVGAFFLLWLFGQSLNIYSQIGLITLIGLITKHGILLVEFANKAISKGEKASEAIRKGCLLRLRPILMTTAAMLLGALPLIFASGAGSEARRAIGFVLVGGLSVGTLLTLYVLPYIYIQVKSWRSN